MDRELDYLVPEALRDQVRVGTIVRIPLGPRRERAWVVDVDVSPPSGVTLRPVATVTGWGPPSELIGLARWAAHRWAGRHADFRLRPSPDVAVSRLPACLPARSGPAPRDRAAAASLAAGGGVLRVPPAADLLPVALAAMARGPALVITPALDAARLLALRLRRSGQSVALYPRDWV